MVRYRDRWLVAVIALAFVLVASTVWDGDGRGLMVETPSAVQATPVARVWDGV
jgi:hypothetical protein